MKTERESTGASEILDPSLRDTEWVSTREFEWDVRRRMALRLFAFLLVFVPVMFLLGYFGASLNKAPSSPSRIEKHQEVERMMKASPVWEYMKSEEYLHEMMQTGRSEKMEKLQAEEDRKFWVQVLGEETVRESETAPWLTHRP